MFEKLDKSTVTMWNYCKIEYETDNPRKMEQN